MDFQQRFKGKISHISKDGVIPKLNYSQKESKTHREMSSQNLQNRIENNQPKEYPQKNYINQYNPLDYKNTEQEIKYKPLIQSNRNNGFKQNAEQIIKTTESNQRSKTQSHQMHSNQIQYTPYTLQDYQNIKQKFNVKPQGLGPMMNQEDWQKKQQNYQKIQQFSQQVNQYNQKKIGNLQKPKFPKIAQTENYRSEQFIKEYLGI